MQSNCVRTLKGLISFAIVRSSLAVIGKYSSIAYFSSCSVSKSNCSSLDGAMSVKSAKMFQPPKWGLPASLLCHFYQKQALKTKAHNPCMINYWHLNTHENIKYDGVKSGVWFFCPSSCSLYFAKLQKNNSFVELYAVKL